MCISITSLTGGCVRKKSPVLLNVYYYCSLRLAVLVLCSNSSIIPVRVCEVLPVTFSGVLCTLYEARRSSSLLCACCIFSAKETRHDLRYYFLAMVVTFFNHLGMTITAGSISSHVPTLSFPAFAFFVHLSLLTTCSTTPNTALQ